MRSELDVKDSHRISALVKSFYYAISGLLTALRLGRNIKVHCLAALVVIVAGMIVGLHLIEWAILVVMIAQVMTAELINSALEFVVDLVSPHYHTLAKYAKDIAAGAVLLSASAAIIVGGLIFWPYFN